MRSVNLALPLLLGTVAASTCPFANLGTPPAGTAEVIAPQSRAAYMQYIKTLDIARLYAVIAGVLKKSQTCWPADGPQDGDEANYAGLMGRLAWHCAGTLRMDGGTAYGGCEGGGIRFWPEREWRDNGNLNEARAILGEVKNMAEYQALSWGDLITFAGTVGIRESGGPAKKFCFGRVDAADGSASVQLGVEGVTQCVGANCVTDGPCPATFHHADQDPTDVGRCNFTQAGGRLQASHSVGLIYVIPAGPKLRTDHAEYDGTKAHQRSARLSAEEVWDTFTARMGWTEQETVALIGGGHTLGRAHGNCANANGATCNGQFTKTSGYEGAWTRTPSKWNYEYFEAMLDGTEWEPSVSPDGEDQWKTKLSTSKWASTFRLTADLALVSKPVYKTWAERYRIDHDLFNSDFADAWFKLMHRSGAHPGENDLEADFKTCTDFSFLTPVVLPPPTGDDDDKAWQIAVPVSCAVVLIVALVLIFVYCLGNKDETAPASKETEEVEAKKEDTKNVPF